MTDPIAALYDAAGSITIHVDDGRVTFTRGAVARVVVDPTPSLLARCVSLVRWGPWLRKARLGTLRWMAQNGGILAGGGRGQLTASVQSQLTRAGLLEPSRLWGWDSTAIQSEGLGSWVVCELKRRGKWEGAG